MTRGQKVLFIVGAEGLVYQAQEKFSVLNPDFSVGVEKAERFADLDRHDIVIASIQSLSKKTRLARFPRNSFHQIGIDEAHWLKPGGMFHDVMRHFRCLKSEPDFDPRILLYGLTATTNRSDGVGLEHSFSKITFQRTLLDLMRDGIEIDHALYPYIADIICHRVDTYADIGSVHVSGGDLDDKELLNAIDTPERNKIIVDGYQKLGQRLPAFAWTIDIAHSTHIVEAFEAAGIRAAVMQGSTSPDERRRMFAGLDDGSLKVIASTGVLREGIDREQVTIGLMCRPHKASLPYQQKVGRILRPFPSPENYLKILQRGQRPQRIKHRAILIDFVDQAGRHSLIGAGSLFGLRNDFDMRGRSALEVVTDVEKLEAETALDLRKQGSIYEMRSAIEQIDILKPPTTPPEIRGWSKLQWLEVRPGRWVLNIHSNRSIRIKLNQLGIFEVHWSDKGMSQMRSVERSLRAAIEAGDKLVGRKESRSLSEDAAWHSDPPGEAQCAYLFRLDGKRLKQHHKDGREFYQFALAEFNRGNLTYSKGSISNLINSKVATRTIAVQRAIAKSKAARKRFS